MATDTVLGEGGGSLSGGEKQRISIARAMLKDAPIVILDEATASVDPENEAELQAAISSLTKGKTLILIAHRLKTVRNADQILVLNGGHIVQRGTHEELIAQPGLYADFVHVRAKANSWSWRLDAAAYLPAGLRCIMGWGGTSMELNLRDRSRSSLSDGDWSLSSAGNLVLNTTFLKRFGRCFSCAG